MPYFPHSGVEASNLSEAIMGMNPLLQSLCSCHFIDMEEPIK